MNMHQTDRPEAALLLGLLIFAGCGTAAEGLKEVHRTERSALESLYDGIAGFETDDHRNVIAVAYGPVDPMVTVTDAEAAQLTRLTKLKHRLLEQSDIKGGPLRQTRRFKVGFIESSRWDTFSLEGSVKRQPNLPNTIDIIDIATALTIMVKK